MTSLAYSFTIEKVNVKIIFGHKILTCQPIFKNLMALLRVLGCKRIVILHLPNVFKDNVICKQGVSK